LVSLRHDRAAALTLVVGDGHRLRLCEGPRFGKPLIDRLSSDWTLGEGVA
jgi:hypothetical protein